jgi:hypothetical protein
LQARFAEARLYLLKNIDLFGCQVRGPGESSGALLPQILN